MRSAGGWRSRPLPEAALAAVAIGDAVRRAAARLAAAGCSTPQLDAEVLMAFALGVGRERLVIDASRVVDTGRFDQLVGRREAPGARFAGADGLELIRRLVFQADGAGVPMLALEIGFGQANAVDALLRRSGYGSVERLCDLAGIERVIVGRRR